MTKVFDLLFRFVKSPLALYVANSEFVSFVEIVESFVTNSMLCKTNLQGL